MRLELYCQDNSGLVGELLKVVEANHSMISDVVTSDAGRVCLDIVTPNSDNQSNLLADIRSITGVTDVRSVSWMPSQGLQVLPDPVMLLDHTGRVEQANTASCKLFALDEQQLCQQNIASLLAGVNFSHWLESLPRSAMSENVTLEGQHFLIEITPAKAGAMIVMRSAIRIRRQLQDLSSLDVNTFASIVAVSAKMRQVVEQARKLALLTAPLLITGETGTGKDLLAAACHQASPRSQKPYLALNCGSMPDDVVESELFGHAPRAYANAVEGKKGFFEQANGGSVLLDEIGEMSPRMQTKLLRFLNDGTFRRVGEDHEVHVDVRVICATKKNLIELVQKGDFREDLYYRLNVLTLNLPPLRDIPQDIMPLCERFVAQIADEQGITRPKLCQDLTSVLTRYGWPGNVRQLKNVLYRALTQLEGNELRAQDILLPDFDSTSLVVGDEEMQGTLDEITGRFERSVLTQLYHNYPSTRKLAKRLGVSHTAIANKLREYGLNHRKSQVPE